MPNTSAKANYRHWETVVSSASSARGAPTLIRRHCPISGLAGPTTNWLLAIAVLAQPQLRKDPIVVTEIARRVRVPLNHRWGWMTALALRSRAIAVQQSHHNGRQPPAFPPQQELHVAAALLQQYDGWRASLRIYETSLDAFVSSPPPSSEKVISKEMMATRWSEDLLDELRGLALDAVIKAGKWQRAITLVEENVARGVPLNYGASTRLRSLLLKQSPGLDGIIADLEEAKVLLPDRRKSTEPSGGERTEDNGIDSSPSGGVGLTWRSALAMARGDNNPQPVSLPLLVKLSRKGFASWIDSIRIVKALGGSTRMDGESSRIAVGTLLSAAAEDTFRHGSATVGHKTVETIIRNRAPYHARCPEVVPQKALHRLLSRGDASPAPVCGLVASLSQPTSWMASLTILAAMRATKAAVGPYVMPRDINDVAASEVWIHQLGGFVSIPLTIAAVKGLATIDAWDFALRVALATTGVQSEAEVPATVATSPKVARSIVGAHTELLLQLLGVMGRLNAPAELQLATVDRLSQVDRGAMRMRGLHPFMANPKRLPQVLRDVEPQAVRRTLEGFLASPLCSEYRQSHQNIIKVIGRSGTLRRSCWDLALAAHAAHVQNGADHYFDHITIPMLLGVCVASGRKTDALVIAQYARRLGYDTGRYLDTFVRGFPDASDAEIRDWEGS